MCCLWFNQMVGRLVKIMAVYTTVSTNELQALLTDLRLGRLLSVVGVEDGIENSTYFLQVCDSSGATWDWVLTIVENAGPDQTAFSAGLMQHLEARGLPVPELAADQSGRVIHNIAGKRALLSCKVAGAHPAAVSVAHCAAVGDFLGLMHEAGEDFARQLRNAHDLTWARATAARLSTALPDDDAELINRQLMHQQHWRAGASLLPRGPIHADLFRDNTLFAGEQLCAVIDFQSACTDWLLLDVAVAVNDWATVGTGQIDESRALSLLNAYQARRQFVEVERSCWQQVLCRAALQFWLSRLLVVHEQAGEMTGRADKDPEQYARILRQRIAGVMELPH